MADFYPGDTVRFLDEDGEGIVKAVDGAEVLVETPDGFDIPYPASHLVKVSSTKPKAVKSQGAASKPALSRHGLYIAHERRDGDLLPTFLINNTAFDIVYVCSALVQQNAVGKRAGVLKSGALVQLMDRNLKRIEGWHPLHFQVAYFKEGYPAPTPRSFTLKISLKGFFDSLKQAPLLGTEAYLYQLDATDWKSPEGQAKKEKVKKAMADKSGPKPVQPELAPVPELIDLHLEAIPQAPQLGSDEIMPYQLRYASQLLERAVAQGMKEITFIHGVGEGVLKEHLKKLAEDHPNVRRYGKANELKFGQGALYMELG